MKLLAAILVAIPMVASAQLSLETGIGHQGEMMYRLGDRFQLAPHWQVDVGALAVRYKDEHYDHQHLPAGPSGHVFAVDAVVLYEIELGGSLYLAAGTGPSEWSHARWGSQAHGRAWLFSNEVALRWVVTPRIEVGPVYRHYSGLWCRPNTSIDFVGINAAYRFK